MKDEKKVNKAEEVKTEECCEGKKNLSPEELECVNGGRTTSSVTDLEAKAVKRMVSDIQTKHGNWVINQIVF